MKVCYDIASNLIINANINEKYYTATLCLLESNLFALMSDLSDLITLISEQ